ncbi:serine/threonine-protein kinase [Larkinella soli]|uniref:serine/threonine-protein kinase n=1 Tax=Larkinella soli TaxID=1770527 RepID=UPI0013E2A840|nr:serine/threonine-protein kinase [Larkinella soli]
MKGRLIHHYRVESLLGEGGMGTVYQATDTLLERPVAVKMLHTHLVSQGSFMERFRNEALILARLNHPNIAVVYNFLQDGSDYFMAMEYVEGESLESLLRRAGSLPAPVAAEIVRQGLEGLAHAHRKSILHRDIKPANLMLTPEGVIKLMDFGIARVKGEQRLTQANRIVGTLEYMAPELIDGQEPSAASDLYAMGVLLYELLCGKLPFASRTDYELMQAILRHKPIPLRKLNGQVPKELEAIVQKALEKNPEKRFADAKEFQRALQPFYSQAPVLDPTRIVPSVPVTEVLDMKPRRQLDEIRKKAVPLTQARQVMEAARTRFRNSWELVLAGALTLVALLFLGLLLTDRTSEGDAVSNKGKTAAQPVLKYRKPEEKRETPTFTATLPAEKPASGPNDRPVPEESPAEPPTKKTVPQKPAAPGPASGTRSAGRPQSGSQPLEPPVSSPTEPVQNEPVVAEPTRPETSRRSVAVRRLPVSLTLLDNLSSADAREGQAIRFRVAGPVMSGGEVVIASGATAYGEVTRIRRAGNELFRKKDLLEFRILTVDAVNGQPLPLRSATISEESKGQPVVFRAGQSFEVRTGDGIITF